MAALAARPWGRGRPEAELRRVAVKTIATLEGGMIIARTMGDLSLFEDLAADNPATEAGAGP